jgi:hypothetical protein
MLSAAAKMMSPTELESKIFCTVAFMAANTGRSTFGSIAGAM